MRLTAKTTTFVTFASGLAIGAIFFSLIASAWTGPTATAPGNNVAAPLNVGSVNQIKNGNIGVNGLAVFGSTLLGGSDGSNAYLNFGATAGTGGYGIWDNNGTLNFRNTGGTWQPLQTIMQNFLTINGITTNGSGQVTQITFSDNSTMMTASSTATVFGARFQQATSVSSICPLQSVLVGDTVSQGTPYQTCTTPVYSCWSCQIQHGGQGTCCGYSTATCTTQYTASTSIVCQWLK